MIESLHVEGFKSHENSDINFRTGLNVFLGEVGAGKTSILEAVSFALFGKYSGGLAQTGLIRRGGKEAEIRLVFSVNSDKYKVERRIYSKKAQKAKLFILNKEEWKSLVDGANSVTKSIEDLLGVDASTFLAAIYASQGAIKEMLQTQPGKRREQFDKLLGIDVYERLWDTMGESKTLVLKELTEMQDTASGFEVLEEQKKTLSLRIKSDSEEKSLLEAYLKEIRERLKPEEEDLKTLESAKDKAESINERLIENESKIKKTNETIESFKEKLNNALEAEKIFLENSKYIKQDEAFEKEKIRIEKSLQKKDGIKRLIERENDSLKEYIESKKELDEKLAILPDLRLKIREFEEEKLTLSNLKEKQRKTEEALNTTKEKSIRISQKIEIEEKKVNRINELDECPTCLQEVPDEHKIKIRQASNQILEALKKQLIKVNKTKLKIQQEMDSIEEHIESANQAESNFKEFSIQMNTLEENAKNLKKINIRIEEVKNKLEEFIQELNDLKENPDDLSKIESDILEISEKVNLAKEAEKKVAAKKDLESLFDQEQETLKIFKMKDVELKTEKQEIDRQFDPVKYESVKVKIDSLRHSESTSIEGIRRLEISLEDNRKKLGEIDNNLIEKRKANKNVARLKTESKMIDLLRSGLRDIVQPAVRKNNVLKVSEAFHGFYQELSNDNIDFAAIDEDGNIEVTKNGEPSPVYSLSGGETTCAALALRLAICSSLTKNQLLLLDEPTIHLDEVYRAKLRDFLATHNFDQLIVVTHDNTFNSLPAQIFSVQKKRGESIVTPLRIGEND